MNRRQYLMLGGGAAAIRARAASVPSYLRGYDDQYGRNPRSAALQWFRNARFGLFLHYGLYSLRETSERAQLCEKIPVAEYAGLKDQFTASRFDARFITDLALRAGMKYVNITTRHHDSFCLFRTKFTDFSSVNSPARRDLVGELADACRKKRLGLSLYYSHGRDWKHPHAPNNDEWGGNARPEYDRPEPSYKYGKEHHLQKYLDFTTGQITELLTNYGPVAAIWLDGLSVPLSGDRTKFRCQDLYDHIHKLQPQVLVSYKHGLLGTEDFFAPERNGMPSPGGKPTEICDTLQEEVWGYSKGARHKTAGEVMQMLADARRQEANLLLNTGLLPDGSIYEGDVQTLREVGRRLKAGGFPSGKRNRG